MKQGKSHMFIQEGEISSIDEQNVGIPATANSSTTTIINCSRCGAQMRNDARYCMKCGNLNYAHQENKSMQQYATNNSKDNDYRDMSLKNYKASLVDKNGITKTEKKYRIKKFLLTIILLIALGYLVYWGRDYIKMIYEFILEQYEATKKILIK